MNTLLKIGSALALMVSAQSFANDNFYAFAAGGMAESDSDLNSLDGTSYKVGMGYELAPQWYVELGFQQLLDETAIMPTDNNAPADGTESNAIYVAFLGKAASQTGELFYRVGLMNMDVEEYSFLEGSQTCSNGMGSELVLTDSTYTQCSYDDSGMAGVFGLGFDFTLTQNVMIRTEAEYIKGEDNVEVSAAYIGVRVNF